ncbi:type VI secretion system tip protein VgrG [Pectobacterium versatile]|uniref:type VI secretion system tip protein VgrG n=1 Tax=Pectobacterium versatile TaxID=2488639 RepID=UPI001CF3BE78|nr:type VI secretion system tip protein VgrG [Pectobacterium versatile]MCA6924673.1 type VI secretion system tip protein VgrG [Pectobacterium versatile]MCH5081437.1 type VI secretion system tip protein VgrG [Pectobacterium versatile]
MATSPSSNSTGVTTYTIKVGGNAIDSSIGVIAIYISYQINHIATAEITISDGDMASQRFDISDAETFKPGSTISISAGYASDEKTIFEGIIISHGIEITSNNSTFLNIVCKDQAIAMTIAKHSQCFLAKSDSNIISGLIAKYSNVTSSVGSITDTHAELVQFNSTDWDFILTRAEANGFVVTNQSNKVTINKPSVSGSATLIVTYGIDLMSFSAKVDARNQLNSVTATAWDSTKQNMVTGTGSVQSISGQGNFSSNDLAQVLGISDYTLQTSSTVSSDSLTSWANGQQVKAMLSKVRGSVTFQGNASAKIDSLLELAGVGERYNGSHYIGGIRHNIEKGQWITIAELGMSPMWSAEHRDIGAPPASGYLPPVDGLQIGVVTKLNEDPDSNYRIQIKIPTLNSESNLIWARLATYYASSGCGNFFIPEVGDEVIVGCINQDPSNPIILGSLYSSKNKMPNELTAENNIKTIVTKSKLKVIFDDENSVMTLETPNGNSIVMSDKDKSITLTDQNSNTISMGESGINITSNKDITISAKNAVKIESTGDTTVKATGDAKISGLNVSVQANTGLTLKGNATAELSCSGITTIKGAIVKIN